MFRLNRDLFPARKVKKHQPQSGAFFVDNISIERKAIKHLYLRLDPGSGKVCVSAPRHMPDADIAVFLQKKQRWIAQKRQQLQHKIQLLPLAELSADSIRLWGDVYSLKASPEYTEIFVDKDNRVCLPDRVMTDKHLLSQWLRQQLTERIEMRLPVFESLTGTRVSEWRIRAMKTRWGTCNTRAARIWINAELVQLPKECLDYILLHELVHLLEPSHNARFHRLMTEFMPHWPEQDQRLNCYLLPR